MQHIYKIFLLAIILILAKGYCAGQGLLDKPVTLALKKKPVKDVLDHISKRGGFSFSYNAGIIPGDSLVSVDVTAKPVRWVLKSLFGERYEYKEVNNYIVILPSEKEKWFTLSGYVTDATTGIIITDASVFERHQLISTLTDQDGHFRLRVKDRGKYAMAEITFSKGVFYKDTTVSLYQGYDQDIPIRLIPSNYTLPDVLITQSNDVEKSWLGRLLFSSKLRQQSANLGRFFVDKPVQASFIPGIGTHGKISSQVTNSLSFNILGGYSGGVSGVEVGGLFNIDKKDVKYMQVGGILNIVTGDVSGMEVSGVLNVVKGSVAGMQTAGVVNVVSGSVTGMQVSGVVSQVSEDIKGMCVSGVCNRGGCSMKGLQVAGVVNLLDCEDTSCSMDGMQVAGIGNLVNSCARGAQVAGILNLCSKKMQGLQLSGICNISKEMTGVQIGLLNIADTIDGYCIGLVNIVRKGYHAIGLTSNELTNLNFVYKAGTKKLYSVFSAGTNTLPGKRAFIYGFGIGSEQVVSKHIGIAGELSAHSLYEGNTTNTPLVVKFEPLINWNITPKISLFTGPSLSLTPYVSPSFEPGNLHGVPTTTVYEFRYAGTSAMWVGWQAGFHIF